MARGVRLYLVGSVVLVVLAGCGRSWFAEREPWRREAEVACLKSGTVKQGPTIVQVEPISGPGICGADFPLKVAALGDAPALSFGDDLRPPGSIPHGSVSARVPPLLRAPPSAAPPYVAPAPATPLSLRPPGMPSSETEVEPDDESDPRPGAGQPPRAPYMSRPAAPARMPLSPSQTAMRPTGPTEITPPATLACPLVSALDQWIANSVQPAAVRWFGQPVVEIKQISAYSCRGMNGQRNAKISEHAFGNALDIAAFTLADGRKVTVRDGWRGMPEEQGFLRDVHASACEQFSTVLSPGSNAFHYDHLHVDLMRRASGRAICNPEPVAGEVIAARASARGVARNALVPPGGRADPGLDPRATSRDPWERRDDPFGVRRRSDVTGSVARRSRAQISQTDNGLPAAIAGED